jgi:phytoene synthase
MKTDNKIFSRITQKASKTFYIASLFFPKEIRQDVFILYAFVRTIDDLVDCQPPKKNLFLKYKKLTTLAFEGKKTNNFLIDSFYAMAKRKNIPRKWVEDFFTSQLLDLKTNEYETFKDLEKFIYGVAEIIGLMMAKITNLPEKSYPYAQALGKAMQLINNLRDINEDFKRGRTYIPQKDLKKFNLRSVIPKNNIDKQNFEKLIRFEINRFYDFAQMAEKGFKYIPKKYLLPIKASLEIYRYVAGIINKKPIVILEKKIKPNIALIYWTLIKNLLWIR